MTRSFKVGYQIHPQHCTSDQIREAYKAADALGADTIWVWDHMFPLSGDPAGSHYASTPILAAMAVETRNALFGALVASNTYRNPEFYTYEVATLDHLSHGRAILGLGAGWFERDHAEYGYEFGDVPYRLRELRLALPRIKERLRKLDNPRPPGRIPIMIGGAGEKVTLRLVAEYADMWNTFPPLETWRRKNEILNEWCAKVGRDPQAVERTMSVNADQFGELDAFVEAGAQHFILRGAQPFDMKLVEQLVKLSGK